MEVGGLKSSYVFVDSIVFKQQTYWGAEGHKIDAFFVDIINVRPLTLLYFMLFKSLEQRKKYTMYKVRSLL